MQAAKYGNLDVQVIRAANHMDGDGFEKNQNQVLIYLPDGSKKIVLRKEVITQEQADEITGSIAAVGIKPRA